MGPERTTLRRPVAARATRSARWVASVPDEVNRTRSTDGTSSFTACAQRTSPSWLDPKWVPRPRASTMTRSMSGWVVSEHQGAVPAEVVDVLVAVDVPLAGPSAGRRRSCRGRACGCRGDPAREQLPRFLRQLGGAAGAFAVGGLDAGVAESFHQGISVVGSGPTGLRAVGRRVGPVVRLAAATVLRGRRPHRAGACSRPAGHGGARRRPRPFRPCGASATNIGEISRLVSCHSSNVGGCSQS